MDQNTSITLGEHFQSVAASLIEDGRYDTVSECVRAGMRLLEEEEAKLKTLRAAVAKGETSGYADGSFSFPAFRTRMRETYGAES